ncbi:MAG: hypothetical protein ABI652_04645, partial [Acidobacteriota bacterium]
VHEPEQSMRAICESLGLEFDAGVLDPYRNKEQKALDGLHPQSKSMGDPKFHAFTAIMTGPADAPWSVASLAAPTVELAASLGYDVAGVAATPVGNSIASARARDTRSALDARRQQRRQTLKA